MRAAALPRPFIKWAGGKSRLWRDALRYLVPVRATGYYEPFVGGGAVYFAAGPKTAVLSDKNRRLIGAYRFVQMDVEVVIRDLRVLQMEYDRRGHDGRREMYYQVRSLLNAGRLGFSAHNMAGLFIFLNKTGFNGLYRENRKGEINVPFGDGRDKALFDEVSLRAAGGCLQQAEIYCLDFAQMLAAAPGGSFAYIDPPYIPVDGNSFTGYNGAGFAHKDQLRLVQVCRELDNRGVLFMLSNSDTPLTRELYREWQATTYRVLAGRSINADGSGRGRVGELVVTNYPLSWTANREAAAALRLEGGNG